MADGHGGHLAAVHVSEKLIPYICQRAADGSAEALHEAVVEGFAEMHKSVCALGGLSGTTLTVVVYNATRGELSSWNVGDSSALLVHEGGYELLSESHRLQDSKSEQERVTSLGAKLGRALDAKGEPGGPIRSWPGGLAVTRTIGDADCLNYISAIPYHHASLKPADGGAVVLCTDGVWDHLRPEEVSAVLLAGGYHKPSAAAHLVIKATQRASHGLTDDTTCVVMLFGPANIEAEVKTGGDSSPNGRGSPNSRVLFPPAVDLTSAMDRSSPEEPRNTTTRFFTNLFSTISDNIGSRDPSPEPAEQKPIDLSSSGPRSPVQIRTPDRTEHDASVKAGNAFEPETMLRTSPNTGGEAATERGGSAPIRARRPSFIDQHSTTAGIISMAPASSDWNRSPSPHSQKSDDSNSPSFNRGKTQGRRLTTLLTGQFDLMMAPNKETMMRSRRGSRTGAVYRRSLG